MNLEAFRDEIKAITSDCKGTPTAKLIAILEAAGITSTKEIAELLNLKPRAIQCARKSATQCASATECAQLNAHAQRSAPKAQRSAHQSATECASEPSRIHARLESPSGIVSILEDKTNTPLPPKAPKGPTPTEALKAFTAYNETALRCGLSQAARLTPERQRRIIARLKTYGLEGWMQALANIERSSYLTGKNDRGWRADLDFMLQAKSFDRLHDGGYGNGRHAETKTPVAMPSHWQALVDEAKAAGYAS